MNHQKIILQIKNGNQKALEMLIQEMYPQVYAFLYRKMNENDKAKDITQEVFIRFVENIDAYHEEEKLRNYLFRIGINLVNNYYRSLKYLDDQQLDENRMVDQTNPHDIVMKKTSQDIMMAYISKLNTISREIIILRYYHEVCEGFSKCLLSVCHDIDSRLFVFLNKCIYKHQTCHSTI